MTDDGRGPLPAKLYFRIGEVAGMVGVEPHVLRYWEREFRTIRPTKSAKGQRVYSRRDVENLMRVRDLLYGQGFTIAGARKRLRDKGVEPGDDADAAPDTSRTPEAALDATPAPVSGMALTAPAAALPEPRLGAAPPTTDRMREQLEDLKVEIEAFLEELGT